MNVQQMHLAVQQGVDKINSLQADTLLREEIIYIEKVLKKVKKELTILEI